MTVLWKLVGVRGAIGIAVALILSTLLLIQKGETRHWHKQSDQWERKYDAEHAAFVKTVAGYRAAADEAKRLDAANADRVKADQSKINQESSDAYETRLAAARAAADRLRAQLAAAAHSGSRPGAPVPGLPAAAGGLAQAARKDGLSLDDALIATEQAIQLDELAKWVRKQAGVNVNGPAPATQGSKP